MKNKSNCIENYMIPFKKTKNYHDIYLIYMIFVEKLLLENIA